MTTKHRTPEEDAADAATRSLSFMSRIGTPAQRAASERLKQKIAEWASAETDSVSMSRRPVRKVSAKSAGAEAKA